MGNDQMLPNRPRQSEDTATLAIQLTRKAISLYKGHFLEVEPEQGWILSPQKRLRAKYIRGIESLAGYWESAGELEMAIQCYEKALEADDTAEEFYQRLMIIYQRLGRRTKALAVYSRCRSVLEARLGIEPSHKTEAIILLPQQHAIIKLLKAEGLLLGVFNLQHVITFRNILITLEHFLLLLNKINPCAICEFHRY